MKSITTINGQVVDAVTSTNVQVQASAPAVAMGNLYNTLANNQGLAAMNAVYAQQQTNIAHQAATTRAVALLLGDLN